MRATLRSIPLILAAAACGWLVRGAGSPAPAAAPIASAPVRSTPASAPTPPPTGIVTVVAAPRAVTAGRNLFAYRETPRRPEPRFLAPQPVVEEVVTPVVAIAPQALVVPRPRFPYRFIGTFGPEHDRLAAFVRGQEIVTARPGDRIGGGFVLRSIGIESVEVEPDDASGTQRVPLASEI